MVGIDNIQKLIKPIRQLITIVSTKLLIHSRILEMVKVILDSQLVINTKKSKNKIAITVIIQIVIIQTATIQIMNKNNKSWVINDYISGLY